MSVSSPQGATPKMVPVPLAQMTVPEDHYERDYTIRRALMAMAGEPIIIWGNTMSDAVTMVNNTNSRSRSHHHARQI
jgi:hypothetical protein